MKIISSLSSCFKKLPLLVVLVTSFSFAPLQSVYALNTEKTQSATFADISMMSTIVVSEVIKSVVQIQVVGVNVTEQSHKSRGEISRFRATGSGFIIDPDGYIITNAHVVSGAQKIRVILPNIDPDEKYVSILKPESDPLDARLIGMDQETDLAVLKIDRTDLIPLALADFDTVRVGELVWAIGSPLGLRNSVTMGIVSTVARQLEKDNPMIFLQTDAAVNPGSSGGPIVNSHSEVVAVSSNILSRGGGSDGITLSIPSHIVSSIYEQIIKHGYVIRGEIGIKAQTITPQFSDALGLGVSKGVILADVIPGGPAFTAELRPWDIVLSVDGKAVENARQLIVNLYQKPIGETVQLQILSQSETKEVSVLIEEKRMMQDLLGGVNNVFIPHFGILVTNTEDKKSGLSKYKRGAGGVRVSAKLADSPQQITEIQTDDIIYSVNQSSVFTVKDMLRVVRKLNRGDAVVLHLQRGNKLEFVSFYLD